MKQSKKAKLILGIDTSCDDTSAAIVDGRFVLSNVVSSQIELHREFGGVVPMIAKREHQERILPVISKAFKVASRQSGKLITWDDIDAIAVTYGPGLAIALEVGLVTAKDLCQKYDKKLVAVNHMEGHLWSSLAANSRGKGGINFDKVEFPALGILISGGHTEFVLIEAFGKYRVVGETLDDAMGEAFDKVARMIGLGYPGGAVLSEMAKNGNSNAYKLPVPLKYEKTNNMSYSGLKTAVYYLVNGIKKESPNLTKQQILDLAASFEKAAIEELNVKFERVLKEFPVKMIFIGGGVSSSKKVRATIRKTAQNLRLKCFFPLLKHLNMDNGAMIAIAGHLKSLRGEYSETTIDRDPRASIAG